MYLSIHQALTLGGLPISHPPVNQHCYVYTDVKNLIYFYPLWAKNPPYYTQNRKNKLQGGLS